MEAIKKKIFDMGYIPVTSFAGSKDAAICAQAMHHGEVTVMEVNSVEAVRSVVKAVPEMTVGMSVSTPAQCQQALEAGAGFLLCDKWNEDMIRACREKEALLIPDCSTLAEVTRAQKAGLLLMHYAPAVGVDDLRHLARVFTSYPDARFILTVGDDFAEIDRCASAPFVFALRGRWLQSTDAAAPDYADQITELCQNIFTHVLGFEMFHLGINMENTAAACQLADDLHSAFRMKPRDNGPSSRFVGTEFEIMKRMYRGKNGHFAIGTNNVDRAMAYVTSKGYEMDMDTAYVSDGRILTVYMKEEYNFGGFAAHFTQKNSPWPR